ncbi:MAG: NAD(P)H-dependent oxidoreductase [Cardiobacteriaceae bacterium]|nr:NAD(P)H-dependent oxidoreductase [Cardiobacteriaceae bacterium]
MSILLINAHPDPNSLLSATNQMVGHLLNKVSSDTIDTINLADTDLQTLDKTVQDMFINTFFRKQQPTPAEAQIIEKMNTQTTRLKAATRLVIALPMYNFGIPARLKDWIDNIVIPGQTFQYGADGSPQGLLTSHKALILTASGGIYSEGAFAPYDFTIPYLQTVLGFLGIQHIYSVRAEGTSPDAVGVEDAVQKACTEIDAIWRDFSA